MRIGSRFVLRRCLFGDRVTRVRDVGRRVSSTPRFPTVLLFLITPEWPAQGIDSSGLGGLGRGTTMTRHELSRRAL